MIIFKKSTDKMALPEKEGKVTIGFVPTMGALHGGHISLLEKSKETCDKVICSIFINPTQFNNAEDYKKYPVTIEADIYMLEKMGTDILFLPGVTDIYPEGTGSKKHFDLGTLESILEGKFRPGHFQGVCQVVKRLLEIVRPTHLFLGQKDYQQCLVIKKMLEMENWDIDLTICPTLREENGLAMSSRNMRLSGQQKEEASQIYKTLVGMKEKIKAGPLDHLKKEASGYLVSKNIIPDYVEIADAADLHAVPEWDGKSDLVILAAAFIGGVRLIDNILLKN